MRLNRGAGVRGLGGMRPTSPIPQVRHPRERGDPPILLRPLLGWRRAELERICADAGLAAATDPSNADDRFERVRVRKALSDADWLEPSALAASATHLASADEALDWATDREWRGAVREENGRITYTPSNAPPEIVRRLVARAITALAAEGAAEPLRARELDPLLATLRSGAQATLRGVLCSGGSQWRFSPAPQRRR